MLRPEKMVKIRVVGTLEKKDVIIDDLHDLGVMQIENVDPSVIKIFDRQVNEEDYKTISDYLAEFRGYISILPKKPIKNKVYFNSYNDLISEISKINIKDELNDLKSKEDAYLGDIRENENFIRIFTIIKDFNIDVSALNNSYVESFLIEVNDKIEKLSADYMNKIRTGNYYLVTINRKYEDKFLPSLSGLSSQILHIPEFNGTPSKIINDCNKKIEEDRKNLEIISNELNKISDTYYEKIVQIEEQLEVEYKEAEISGQIAATGNVFALEGWIAQKDFDKTMDIIEKDTDNQVIIQKIKTKEDPPTQLSNPKHLKIFEFFIRFYSLPKEYEIDPTLIFAIIFPIFFGVMVGDAGYGLVILLFSLFIIHRLNHPPAVSHIPKKLTNFVFMIMGKNALMNLAKALIPGSIIAIAVGLYFNAFFGFTIYPPFHVAQRPIPVIYIGKLLLISGYIGLGLVTFGFILGIINNIYINHKKESVAKFGWILLAWALAILGLNLIHRISLSPTNFSSLLGYIMFAVGFVLIIAFEGTQSLMEIPSIISHILSYTRIVGILLASVVLALVINTVFVSTLSGPIYFVVLGLIILIFGQLFNLIIAVFEPGIQGARLLYVEFFSKFYFGNGRQFHPFKTDRKYTLRKFDRTK
ncbi:V-type ATP synthase subunit I [Acidiplasma sp.]|uniref:V-type ATP synthase subunit I n=1 Tax=Acidiplasma sp. TaxID=1872114 RepID=UPI0025886597|nr:V-type ATP synthase subunit I [Acidiplasma sp.]